MPPRDTFNTTGFTVAYEPEDEQPLADIIFVHGIQGHAYKTWAYTSPVHAELRKSLRSRLKRIVGGGARSSKETANLDIQSFGSEGSPEDPDLRSPGPHSEVFWPADLLYALNRQCVLGRPIIFVVHSLGGILVKETLALCDVSDNLVLHDIVKAVRSVVFLGTPHRGGGDYANVGDLARRVASVCLLDTNPALLDSLGLRNADLERSQDNFSRLWRKYGFSVKTFHEALPLSGVGIPGAFLNKLVVPHYSSLIGADREQAETLQANHMDMCRYSGLLDANYIKVRGELEAICRTIATNSEELHEKMKDVRKSLAFPEMEHRSHLLSPPLDNTCVWLTESEQYRSWVGQSNVDKFHGLLWIKGKPGSGKSTLMNFLQSKLGEIDAEASQASFFFNARGTTLENSTSGLFRSLVYQLLQYYPEEFQSLYQQYRDKVERGMAVKWYDEELKAYLVSISTSVGHTRGMFLFIDGLDECRQGEGRKLVQFFRELTDMAYANGARLSVCISSQSVLEVTTLSTTQYLEIILEEHNLEDIKYYVRKKLGSLRCSMESASDKQTWDSLEQLIISKASGVFLWVVLVIEMLVTEIDHGRGIQYLENELQKVPTELGDLFRRVLREVDKTLTTRFFQWVIFTLRPLRISEWSQVLAFVYDPTATAIIEWPLSPHRPETEAQLEKRIRYLSCGLVEVKDVEMLSNGVEPKRSDEVDSLIAGAGSFSMGKVVQVIHSSVREFFLSGDGFVAIDSLCPYNLLGRSNMLIANACLTYAASPQLRSFVEARSQAESAPASINEPENPMLAPRIGPVRLRRKGSFVSFGSSAGSDYAISAYSSQSIDSGTSRFLFRATRQITKVASRISSHLPEIATMRQYRANASKTPKPLRMTSSSSTVSTRLLQTFPPWMQYAAEMFELHITLAQEEGMDQKEIVGRLLSGDWHSWYPLREDISQGTTLMYYAAEANLVSWIKRLINGFGRSPDEVSGHLRYPILIAAHRGNMEALNFLLSQRKPLEDIKDGRGRNIFHHSAISDKVKILDFVVRHHDEHYPDSDLLNATDVYLQTPLYLAASFCSSTIVERLIQAGAHVRAIDGANNNPLHLACLREAVDLDICHALIKAGSCTGARNHNNQTPRQIAREREMVELDCLFETYHPSRASLPFDNSGFVSLLRTSGAVVLKLLNWISS